MTSPLERAARALYLLDPQTMDVFTRDCADPKSVVSIGIRPIDWDDLDDEDRDPFVKAARAVLLAIREPFQSFDDPVAVAGAEVLGVGKDRPLHWSNHDEAKRVWQAMIDAALSEKPE